MIFKVESYLAEQFRQITHYLAELFRQIAHYLAEHLILRNHISYQWSRVLVDSTILVHFKANFLANLGMTLVFYKHSMKIYYIW